ncbi:MAG TPA: helix-turn-helix transcriptional regulator [Williamwhitmania sp.]|nr:helix-turn-helix transcriptional regulator [Williamwhitmania sp.]
MKNWLKVERAKRNITQADLANALNVSRQTINSIELGKFIPSTVLALRLAKYFNVKVEDIFFLEDNEK